MRGWSAFVVASALASAVAPACSFTPPAAVGDDTGVPLPTVAFAADASTTDETAGTFAVTVELSEATGIPVTVEVAATGGSATAGSDFTLAAGTVSFGVGDRQATVELAIADDGLMTEQAETIELTLSSPSGATLGSPATHTVTISDHRLPRVQLSTDTSSTTEDNPTQLTLTLDLPAEAESTVELALAGTATEGDDFALVANTTVTFAAGETTATVDVGEIDDALDEEDAETLVVTLANASSNLIIGDVATQTHTILDDDDPPDVGFTDPNSTVGEADGTTTLEVTLDAPSGRTVTVEFAVNGGNAAAADATVEGAPGTLTFPPGTVSRTITVDIVQDDLDENNETVVVRVRNPSNAGLGTATHTLTITDDDDEPQVEFDPAQSDQSIDEGDPPPGSTKFTYDLVLDRASGKNISVAILFTGDADSGDFTATGVPVVFTPGQTRRTITLDIIADTVKESGGSDDIIMTIDGTTSTNVRVGNNDERRHLILDDDD